MTKNSQREQIEFGDFQTPLELAKRVCQKLDELGVTPETIIEPTCGVGAFVEASANQFAKAKKIIGIEINEKYLDELDKKKKDFHLKNRIVFTQGDFFSFDWDMLVNNSKGSILVVGNFPWVTNSQQGTIGGINLPTKNNFQNHNGFDAMTGKSNFDISEWMLIQTANWLKNRKGYLAMLVKTSVARKFLSHLHSEKIGVLRSAIYGIDAKYYFDVSVDACLLFCEFDTQSHNYDYDVYESLDSTQSERVGHRNGVTVRDLVTFERLSDYFGNSKTKWRSGVKHDCSDVMEFQKAGESYINGLGEVVKIESTYLYPLLKGSDVANGRIEKTNRYVLVTQKTVGESTSSIKDIAPKTWNYLQSHAKYLNERKSRIYKTNPPFSIFGVGSYTFAPYKIAICGLYKKLAFQLVRQIEGKPVVFDDTVYFLSFNTKQEANNIFSILSSPLARDFYSALIFWDEKRPIKTSILNSLNLQQFESSQVLRLF
ncbi:MAG: SAM-dependent methyltransferase [Bacteroidetes bacterium]|nr:SAM-dependent methyltransferase [Bacteroidota bacterium]